MNHFQMLETRMLQPKMFKFVQCDVIRGLHSVPG
jgi:hypothetical protein